MSVQTVYQLSVICGGIEVKLDPQHELVILAQRIDWVKLTEKLAPFYSPIIRQGEAALPDDWTADSQAPLRPFRPGNRQNAFGKHLLEVVLWTAERHS